MIVWKGNERMRIDIQKEHGRYAIYYNEDFYCTCESWHEVDEEIDDLMQIENLSYMSAI